MFIADKVLISRCCKITTNEKLSKYIQIKHLFITNIKYTFIVKQLFINKEIFMRILTRIMLLGVMLISFLAMNMKAYAAPEVGGYGLSCTNDAYGTQHGGIYIAAGNYANGNGEFGVYTGLDCVYSGAGITNSSAIVGGEIARAAANAVIGAVSQRLSTAMNMHSDTAANMSYTTNGNGIGMAANHIVGGMSLWTQYSSSSFENDQTYWCS